MLLVCLLALSRPLPHARSRVLACPRGARSCARMFDKPGRGAEDASLRAKEALGTFESLVGSVISTVRTSTDNWLNSGWSVKKRAGQWVPEVRPNSEDIAMRLAPSQDAPPAWLGDAGAGGEYGETIDVQVAAHQADGAATGGLVSMEAARKDGLAVVSSANLQGDFLAFLAERESFDASGVSVAPDGAITFQSRDDLARMVAEFSFEKLRQVSAAARALARYVDDLESELETADVQVVQLRAKMRDAASAAAQREAAFAEVQRRASAIESQLGATEAELEAGERALVEAERRAEDAAGQLLEMQATLRVAEARGDSVAEQRREAESLGVKFEQQLLDAERRALVGERTKRKLAAELEQLARARAEADMRAQSAQEMAMVRVGRARARAACDSRAPPRGCPTRSLTPSALLLPARTRCCPPGDGGALGRRRGCSGAQGGGARADADQARALERAAPGGHRRDRGQARRDGGRRRGGWAGAGRGRRRPGCGDAPAPRRAARHFGFGPRGRARVRGRAGCGRVGRRQIDRPARALADAQGRLGRGVRRCAPLPLANSNRALQAPRLLLRCLALTSSPTFPAACDPMCRHVPWRGPAGYGLEPSGTVAELRARLRAERKLRRGQEAAHVAVGV